VFTFTADEQLTSRGKNLPEGKVCSATYPNRLRELCRDRHPSRAVPHAIIVADEHVFYRDDCGPLQGPLGPGSAQPFSVLRLPAEVDGINIACQALLLTHTQVRQFPECKSVVTRFAFPGWLSGDKICDFPDPFTPLGPSGPAAGDADEG
jgi:hypothetical protein